MTELVADDALQFVARQHFNATARHADGGVAGGVTGGKGVDAALVFQHVDLRHRHAGGDGHFFHDIEQLALVRVSGVLIYQTSTHQCGHGAAAGGKLIRLVGAAEKNHRQHANGRTEKDFRIPQGQLNRCAVIAVMRLGLHAGEGDEDDEINRDGEQRDGEDKVKHQPLRLAAGLVLAGKEVHLDLRFWICDSRFNRSA